MSKISYELILHHSCCKNGFAMGSMPSTGQINTTAVPLQTARPSCRVSSVSLNGSSGSVHIKQLRQKTSISKNLFDSFYVVCTLIDYMYNSALTDTSLNS